MNYNNYNPFGGYPTANRYYPPYPQQAQQYQQPQTYAQQQPQQPIQQNFAEVPIQEIRYLTADEIKGYIVTPGSKSMLVDRENGLVHIKWCDMTGQSSVKIYSYTETTDEAVTTKQQKLDINLEELVKKEDLKPFLTTEDLKRFSAKVSEKFDSLEKKIKFNDFLEGENK